MLTYHCPVRAALKDEIARLRKLLEEGKSENSSELMEQLKAQSILIEELRMSSTDRQKETALILEEREKSLNVSEGVLTCWRCMTCLLFNRRKVFRLCKLDTPLAQATFRTSLI